jgi:hypothetical protein
MTEPDPNISNSQSTLTSIRILTWNHIHSISTWAPYSVTVNLERMTILFARRTPIVRPRKGDQGICRNEHWKVSKWRLSLVYRRESWRCVNLLGITNDLTDDQDLMKPMEEIVTRKKLAQKKSNSVEVRFWGSWTSTFADTIKARQCQGLQGSQTCQKDNQERSTSHGDWNGRWRN